MMADDAPSNAAATPEAPVEEAPAKTESTVEDAPVKPAAPAAEEAPETEPAPAPDPDTCKAIAIGLDAFWEGVHGGEWNDTDFEYYLEPAGVLSGPLVCSRSPEGDPQHAGLLMTRAGWRAKTLFLDDVRALVPEGIRLRQAAVALQARDPGKRQVPLVEEVLTHTAAAPLKW